jgi:hypothetical protein
MYSTCLHTCSQPKFRSFGSSCFSPVIAAIAARQDGGTRKDTARQEAVNGTARQEGTHKDTVNTDGAATAEHQAGGPSGCGNGGTQTDDRYRRLRKLLGTTSQEVGHGGGRRGRIIGTGGLLRHRHEGIENGQEAERHEGIDSGQEAEAGKHIVIQLRLVLRAAA